MDFRCTTSPIRISSLETDYSCTSDGCLRGNNAVASDLYEIVKLISVFFKERFGYCGIDGKGKLPRFEINWGEENAAWMCTQGRCSMRFHNRYAIIPEVVAHEYAHAISNGRLGNKNQPGALEEAQADVFGIAFKQWRYEDADWNMGNLRDLSKPRHMAVDFKKGRSDNGYVHDNSSIPSHAFYLAVVGTQTRADGIIAKIWFKAMQKVSFDETFYQFALKTIAIAENNRLVHGAIVRGWMMVGVIVLSPEKPLQEVEATNRKRYPLVKSPPSGRDAAMSRRRPY